MEICISGFMDIHRNHLALWLGPLGWTLFKELQKGKITYLQVSSDIFWKHDEELTFEF